MGLPTGNDAWYSTCDLVGMIIQNRPTIVSQSASLRPDVRAASAVSGEMNPVQRSAGAQASRSECLSAPFKPTAKMLAQGAAAGGVSVEVAWRVYRAMLGATDTG